MGVSFQSHVHVPKHIDVPETLLYDHILDHAPFGGHQRQWGNLLGDKSQSKTFSTRLIVPDNRKDFITGIQACSDDLYSRGEKRHEEVSRASGSRPRWISSSIVSQVSVS